MEHLIWREPSKYRRAKYREFEQNSPFDSLKFATFTFMAILALRGLAEHKESPDSHPPSWSVTCGIALGVAVFTAYLLPRFMGLLANFNVILSEKGVNSNTVGKGVTIRFWPWGNIEYGYVWTEKLHGEHYRVISFCDSNGIVLVTVGLSENVDMLEIEAYLKRNGKYLRHE